VSRIKEGLPWFAKRKTALKGMEAVAMDMSAGYASIVALLWPMVRNSGSTIGPAGRVPTTRGRCGELLRLQSLPEAPQAWSGRTPG